MKCPRCQQESPPQAKFCLECATPLALQCPNCRTQLPAGANFCFECATPVSASGSPPRFASPDTYTPKHLAEAIRPAESTHHAYTIGLAHRAAGTLYLLAGDWGNARAVLQRGVAVLRAGNVRLSFPPDSRRRLLGFGAAGPGGQASEAGDWLREAEDAVAGHATVGMRRAWDDHVLGRTCLLLGRLDAARDLGDRAVELLPSQPGAAAHALHLLGDIATHPDRFDAGSSEAHDRKALALAELRGMRPLIAHCHLGFGKLYRRTDKRDQAQEHLTNATAMYQEMGMTYWLEKAEAEVRELG